MFYHECFFVSQDCLSAITNFFNEKLHIIGYIGIGIAGVMVRIYSWSLTLNHVDILF